MRISIPVTRRAKKQNVIIQCVMRTTAKCRGALVMDGVEEVRLGTDAELATHRFYQGGWRHLKKEKISRTLKGLSSRPTA